MIKAQSQQQQKIIKIMASRYDTLNVSLNSPPKNNSRLNKTIEVSENASQQPESQSENSENVNRFKELYFKNEKLRKELKVLNEKLNQKLEKLKLPSVKKKAMSVDLNHMPPSKALQRELENAYKQVTMYKRQVELLKTKEETPENYEKMRNAENLITFRDFEINDVQEQLKSIKNVKKLQDRVLIVDVENAQLKQRTLDYLSQIKSFKEKIKDIDRKSRKREQDFKKQQAYLIGLETKIRQLHAQQLQLEKPQVEKPKEAAQIQFLQVKEEIAKAKLYHEQQSKRIEEKKKSIKNTKEERIRNEERLREREVELNKMSIMVVSFTRLLKDLQIKKYEQTGVRPQNQTQKEGANNILKLQEIEDINSEPENIDQLVQSNPKYQEMLKSELVSKDEREWKGKTRKVSKGYTNPTDQLFQESGQVTGLKVFFDQNKYIAGIAAILLAKNQRLQSKIFGNITDNELKWESQYGDSIVKIKGSFTDEGYLAEIVLTSRNKIVSRFGNSSNDGFQFSLQNEQTFMGMFGGLRRLGQDVRITQLGFWVSKQ